MSKEEKIEEKIEENINKEAELNKTITELKEQLAQYQKKADELNDKVIFLTNDYANKVKEKGEQANKIVQDKLAELEKKHSEIIEDTKKYGIEKTASKLIEIIDQFKKAIGFESNDEKVKNFLIGFKMFASMFDSLLSSLNISEKVINVGNEFNPSFMDAYDVSNDKEYNDNAVTKVVSNAYFLHDRVVKHGVVIVNKINE
ncbi:MAG: nucleotide exchange factor GrpE [Mycoplasmataceae bacterium]|jgi:molecular chaperone GrpE|nr:nucleotide exchange factor GrpE [Mycoplasmataceae bacterium]